MKNNKNRILYFVFGIGFMVLIVASMTLGYANDRASNTVLPEKPNNIGQTDTDNDEVNKPKPEDPYAIDKNKVDHLTGLLIGFDKSGLLADVLMVGHLDILTNELKIISIPRDLLIDFREEPFKVIKENNPKNRVRYCKLNEVYSYIGRDDNALKDLMLIIESIIDMEIDYYVTVDLTAFKEIVDLVGGVEFEVPMKMYYKDEHQDLYIDLEAGLQVLDGDKAEQLVRYRESYGDLVRIKVQREFLTALITKVLQESNLQQALEIIDAAYKYVETNLAFFDALRYSKYIFNSNLTIDTNNMVTIPSYGKRIDDIWYQVWDKEEVEKVLTPYIR